MKGLVRGCFHDQAIIAVRYMCADRMKRWVLGALEAGSDDEEIAEHTGLDCEQVAAIRLVVCP